MEFLILFGMVAVSLWSIDAMFKKVTKRQDEQTKLLKEILDELKERK